MWPFQAILGNLGWSQAKKIWPANNYSKLSCSIIWTDFPAFFCYQKQRTKEEWFAIVTPWLTQTTTVLFIVGPKYNTFPSALRLQSPRGPVSLPSQYKRSRHDNICSCNFMWHYIKIFLLLQSSGNLFLYWFFWLSIRFLCYLQWCKVYLASRLQQEFHSRN